MTTISYDCHAVLERLDAYRNGELTPTELEAFAAHLAACLHCHCVEKHEQALLERLKATCRDCCPDELRRRILTLCNDPECRGE